MYLKGNRGSELADTLSPDLVFIELTLKITYDLGTKGYKLFTSII